MFVLAVDEAHFVGTAAELWWAEERERLTDGLRVIDGGSVWLHDRGAVLAMTAHLLAHGVPFAAITVTVRDPEAGWNAEAEAAGQTVIGGLA